MWVTRLPALMAGCTIQGFVGSAQEGIWRATTRT
jgi:hypothetical protein